MTPTAFLVLAIAFYIISDLVIFFRQRDRIAGLKALAADRDGEIAEWKAKWAQRDNDAIEAGAELVRRDGRIADLEAELKAAGELPASLREKIRLFRVVLSALTGADQANLSYMDGDDLQHLVDAQLARRKALLETTEGLEAELEARIETDTEKSAELARTIAEREKYRDEAHKLGGMNERIERRLTAEVQVRDRAIEDYRGRLKDLQAEAEKRAHDGYSKGYALGQADAFEKVRQVFPVESV